MKPKILFIMTSNPRSSPRPAEAIRIAAGVGTWQKTEVSVYLRDAAVLALSERFDELVDEESFTRYFPMLAEFGRPVYVQQGAAWLREISRASLPLEEINDARLAKLAADSACLARF